MKFFTGCLVALLLTLTCAPLAVGHFKLIEPESWLVEAANGDPQKAAPCGGTSANPGTPSNMIGKIKGGSKLHLKVQETVFHPGHYRVALAVNSRAELPKDPEVTTTQVANRQGNLAPQSVSAVIMNPVKPPVLADGLFPHTQRPAPMYWETDIDIPNISCAKCTLQIIQFMAQHGLNADGDYSYHHCADLQITADPAKAPTMGWPAAK
jgi:hypothetical protein